MNIKYYLLFLVILSCSATKDLRKETTQQNSFEGYVTYKVSSVKPDMISAEDWNERLKEIMGDQGYYLFKNYYRPNQFAAEINSGLSNGRQVYNPNDSLHYSWEYGTDTAITEDHFAESVIKIKDIIELDTTAVINDIPCQAIRVNLTLGYTIVWYNPNLFGFNGDEYKGAMFDREIIKRINTLPVKMEVPGMMITEMIDYKKEAVNDSLFIVPKFETVQRKPSF